MIWVSDVKLFPGGEKDWDWRETGIQPADVKESMFTGIKMILLFRGVWKRLETTPESVTVLEKAGIATGQLQTEACIDRHNSLRSHVCGGSDSHHLLRGQKLNSNVTP